MDLPHRRVIPGRLLHDRSRVPDARLERRLHTGIERVLRPRRGPDVLRRPLHERTILVKANLLAVDRCVTGNENQQIARFAWIIFTALRQALHFIGCEERSLRFTLAGDDMWQPQRKP